MSKCQLSECWTKSLGVGVTFLLGAVVFLGFEQTYAANHLQLCNDGKVDLLYGTISKVRENEFEYSWYETIAKNSCKYVLSGYESATFSFVVIDPKTGFAHNPIYIPDKAKHSDQLIDRLCVPIGGNKVNRTFSRKILDKFAQKCPKSWVKIRSSFAASANSSVFDSNINIYTFTITPDQYDFENRVW